MRLACRLCLQLGVDDPEAWLDTVEDRVLRLWEAYWRVEPWGMDWHRHAAEMTMVDTLYAVTINPHLKRRDRHTPRSERHFMPPDYAGEMEAKKVAGVGISQQLDQYAQAYRRGNDD